MKTITGPALRALLLDKKTLLLEELVEVRGNVDLSDMPVRSWTFKNIRFKGNIHFGAMEVDKFCVENCTVEGTVSGTLTYKDIFVRGSHIWYSANLTRETIDASQLGEFFGR